MQPGNDMERPNLPATLTKRGSVSVCNHTFPATPAIKDYSAVNAVFFDYPTGACTLTAFGACTFMDCSKSSFQPVNGGDISFGGGTQSATLQYGGLKYNIMTALPTGSLNWASDTAIHISAAGNTLPAFDVTVTMPEPLTVLAPALTTSASQGVPSNQDLVIRWSGGTRDVYTAITTAQTAQFGGDPAERSVRCIFPNAVGTATIPKEALALLPKGAGLEMYVESADVHYVMVGDALVTVRSCAGKDAYLGYVSMQ
jgi:hypothetical protein